MKLDFLIALLLAQVFFLVGGPAAAKDLTQVPGECWQPRMSELHPGEVLYWYTNGQCFSELRAEYRLNKMDRFEELLNNPPPAEEDCDEAPADL